MQILRSLALLAFVSGVALLIYGFVRNSNESPPAAREVKPFEEFNVAAPPTRTPTATRTPATGEVLPTAVPGTPTPTPYDGQVARLKLPRFGVDSEVETIGFKAGTENELDTPHNPHNTGWYNLPDYDKPGFGGNAVFSAHVDYYPDILGPFNRLAESEIGDEVIVTMDDGREYKYRVISRTRYDVRTIPMGDLIWPPNKPEDVEWITLITCGGEFRASTPGGPGEYLHRDVVVAERVPDAVS